MEAKALIPLVRSWIAELPDLLRRLGDWWGKEFVGLFPERIADRLFHRGRTYLNLAVDEDSITLELGSDGRTPIATERIALAAYADSSIDQFLQSHGHERKDVDIGVRLPADNIFCRKLVLPAEASGAVREIVAQDLARKTPFKPQEIYSDHVAVKAAGAKRIAVWQWVTQRKFVDAALLPLRLDLESVAFVLADNRPPVGQPSPLINLRRNARGRRTWVQTAALVLGGSALVLASVAGGLTYWRQQTMIDDLDARIVGAQVKARQVRALIDKLQEQQRVLVRLRLQRGDTPGLIDLWEEATRVLPSHAWLAEFRLAEGTEKQGQQISMFGLSTAAPSLVAVVDGSPMFVDAALTAAVSLDPIEGRERFTLQARVKKPDPIREAAR